MMPKPGRMTDMMKTRRLARENHSARMMTVWLCALALALAFAGASLAWAETPSDDQPHNASRDSQLLGVDVNSILFVKNASTGAEYASLADALEAAQDGQEIVLVGDAEEKGAIVFSAAVTIDLAGHTLVLDAGSQAADTGQGAAFAYEGTGTVRVVDTSGEGSLDIRVGDDPEKCEGVYTGLAITGSGSLSLEDCVVNVTYAGSTRLSTPPEFSLHGVGVHEGSLEMAGSAQLNVKAAEIDNSYGAVVATGVYVHEGASSVVVGEDAQVVVENNARAIEMSRSDGTALVEVSIDEDSDLYGEMQQRFYETASFDSGDSNDNDNVYGTRIYYSKSLELSNGATIRAYSDPVPTASVGTKAAVVAKYLFTTGSWVVSPHMAYGISGEQGQAATLEQSGTVSVSTIRGNAYAIYQPASAGWVTDESHLEASSELDTYLVNQGSFDLADYIDFGRSFDKAITYPAGNSPTFVSLVANRSLVAKAVTMGDEEDPAIEEGLPLETHVENSHVRNVSVTFDKMKDASGNDIADVTVSVPYGETLEQAGVSLPEPADYREGTATYRFVGWRPMYNSSASFTVYDANGLYRSVPFDSGVTNAPIGSVTMHASYVKVDAGKRLVCFRVDFATFTYTVDAGAVPSFEDCVSGRTDEPTCLAAESGYTYTFKGWAEGSLDDNEWKDGMSCYEGDLPAASSDVTYTALFEKELSLITLRLFYMREKVTGGHVYAASKIEDVDWTKDAIEQANSCIRAGDAYAEDGVEYTFLGWSTRKSDIEPMYTDTLPLSYVGWSNSSTFTLYGIYANSAKKTDVYFYVDGELYAQALGVDVSKTLNAAFEESTNPVAPSKEGDTFKGWNTSASAQTYLLGNLVSIASVLPGTADHVDLHAIWKSQVTYEEALVRFFDEDGTTLLLQLQMPTGMTVQQFYDEDYKAPAKDNKVFVGWKEASGTRFYPSKTVVAGNVDVYAIYRTEGASLGKLGSASTLGGTAATGPAVRAAVTQSVGGGALSASFAASPESFEYDGADSIATGEVAAEEVDSNAVGFVLVIAAVVAVLAALAKWFFGRKHEDGEEHVDSVVAPETEAIRF